MPDEPPTRATTEAPPTAPGAFDAAAFAELSRTYSAEGRYRELAAVIEGLLTQTPGPSPTDAGNLRVRVVTLYRDTLREPLRAMHHIERLLRTDPVAEPALKAAESLLDVRLLGHRIAPLLSDAYARLRRPHDELAVLERELKAAHPPRLGEVQRRLAILRLDVLGDTTGALELFVPLVLSSPGDDEVRRRFLEVSERSGHGSIAARTLSRALTYTKDDGARARVGYDLGTVHLALGDSAAALSAFEQVARAGGTEDAVLAAARKLVELLGPAADPKRLARALQTLVELEPTPARKHEAGRRLAELAETFQLGARYSAAGWLALSDSDEGDAALAKLAELCEASGDEKTLAVVLSRQAARAQDRDLARKLGRRSTDLHEKLGDPEAALQVFRMLVERFGPSRDVLDRMAALLEQTGQWEKLVNVLENAVRLAAPEEQASLWVKAGRIRLERLGDEDGAFQAFRRSLALDPGEPTSLLSMERLLREGRHRLPASEILEPIYRQRNDAAKLLGLLELRVDQLRGDPKTSLRLLGEAAELADREPRNAERGIRICHRALLLAKVEDRRLLGVWLERLRHFTTVSGRSERMAEISLEVLGDTDSLEPELVEFACVVADAFAAADNVARARSFLELALSEDPTSPDLLARIDALLAREGTPPEARIARYQGALAAGPPRERRAELLSALADLELSELRSPRAAASTLEGLLEEHPADFAAHTRLLDAYEALGDATALDRELDRGLGALRGRERQLTLARRIARLASQGDEPRALELCRDLLQQEVVEIASLDVAERVFEQAGDVDLLQRTLERRVGAATSTHDKAQALERLGDFFLDQIGESGKAVELWKTAARSYGSAPEEQSRARHLYERILDTVPTDQEAARRLVELYAEGSEWSKVPEVYALCVRTDPSEEKRVELLLALAPRAASAGAAEEFIALADEALWRTGPKSKGFGRQILSAKADVLAASRDRQLDATLTFRNLIDSYGEEDDVQRYLAFLDRTPSEDVRREGMRWLHPWRAERAADPVPVLREWARVEEERLRDPEGALSVWERIALHAPQDREALEHLVRLALSLRDGDRAIETLEKLRATAPEAERSTIDLRMARLSADELGQKESAAKYLGRAMESLGVTPAVTELGATLLASPQARRGAAETFEKAISRLAPDRAAEVTRWLLESTRGAEDLHDQRRVWWERVLAKEEADPTLALASTVEAAIELPDATGLFDRVEDLGKKASDLPAVGAAYRRALDAPLSAEDAERLGARAADYFEQVLGDPASATAVLARVLALAPKARWALDRVKLTLTMQRRYEELLDLYGRAIEAEEDPAQKTDLLDEAVVVARDLASEPDVAMGLLEQLLALRPADARIEAGLERLYERRGHTRRLIDLLLRRAARASGKEASELRARVSGLWLDLGEARPALLLAEPLLAEAAHRERAIAVLEAILGLTPPPGEEDLLHAAQRRAAALLEHEYERLERTSDFLRVTARDVELCEDPAEKIDRLRQIATWSMREPRDPERAFDALSQLIRLEPAVAEYRARAAELPDVASRDERLARVLTQAAEEATPPRPELLLDAARLYGDVLGDRDRAIERYFAALDAAVADPDVGLSAARPLERLLFAEGRAAERCTILERIAGLGSDPAEQRAALTEAARVALDELGDPGRSAALFRKVLEAHPADVDALGGLIQALRSAARPAELIQALETRARLSTDPQTARRDRVRVANLYMEELGDARSATAAWEQMRKELGPDLQSFEALSGLYETEGRWKELILLVRTEVEREGASDRASQLHLRLAELELGHTGDVIAAIRHRGLGGDWEAARSLVESSLADARLAIPALSALTEIAEQAWQAGRDPAEGPLGQSALWAVQTLASTLTARGDHTAAFELCARASKLPFARKHQRELELWAARISDEHLGESERAVQMLRRLFADDPTDGVAAAAASWYGSLLAARGLHEETAELWESQAWRASQAASRNEAADFWIRAASVWEASVGNPDRAIQANTQAAELGSETALEALSRLYRARGEGLHAAEALDGLLAVAPEGARMARALAAADAYLEIGERGVARARLEDALLHGGGDLAPVRARLAGLYREGGAWKTLADLLEAGARQEADPTRRSDALCEVARLHSEKLGDPAAAAVRLEAALTARPDRDELCFELCGLLGQSGKHAEAIAVLRRRVDAYEGRRPRERALVHLRLSELLLASDHRAEGLEELQLAAQIDPSRTDVLYRLAQLARDEGRLADAEQTLRALLLALRRPATADEHAPTQSEVYLGLSEVLRLKGDAAGADDFVESAFDAAQTSERDARRLEAALASLGKSDLIERAIRSRLERAPDAIRGAHALADLVAHHGPPTPEDASLGATVRERAARYATELAADPGSPAPAFRSLHRVFGWLDDGARQAAVLSRWVRAAEAASTPDAEQCYELSAECLAATEHRESGVVLLERAFELRPDPAVAITLLTPLLDASPPSERALRLLERLCQTPGRETLRTRALSRIAELPGAGPSEVRAAVEHALSQGDRATARATLESAISRESPHFEAKDRAALHARLAAICEQDGDFARAAELYERSAIGAESREATELLRKAAALYTERLGEPERAMRILHRLVDEQPSDGALWDAVRDVHRRVARPAELIALIDRNASRVDRAAERAALWLLSARLLVAEGNLDTALSALDRILEVAPADTEALDLRTELLQKTGRHEELLNALGARARAARASGDAAGAVASFLVLGEALERSSKPEDALAAYREALSLESTSTAALRAIVRLSEATPVPPETLASAFDALSTLEQGREAAEHAYRLATIRSEQGDDARAEAALLRGFESDPTHEKLVDELLRRQAERGLWSEVSRIAGRALAASPGSRSLALRACEALRQQGKPDEALAALDALGQDDAEVAHERFVVLRSARRTGAALAALEAAARLDARYLGELSSEVERDGPELEPEVAEPRVLGLVELLEKSGEATRARDLLRRVAESPAPPRAVLEQLARRERDAGNHQEAVTAYRRLLSLDLGDDIEEAALGLADACEKQGRGADARADLERAMERRPGSSALRARLRALYEKLGARDQLARTYLSEATDDADPLARVGALVNAGTLMLEAGDRTQAIRALERAHEQEPAHLDASLLLSRAYRDEGRPRDALTVLSRTAALHSKTRSKDVARLHRAIADLHLLFDEIIEAFEAQRSAFELDRGDTRTAHLLGLLAVDAGDERVAQQALQIVLMSKPTGPDAPEITTEARSAAYYHLATMAREGGDDGRARLMASKALKEAPESARARRLLSELGTQPPSAPRSPQRF